MTITEAALAYDAAPDFIGPPPPPLRLVRAELSPERNALDDATRRSVTCSDKLDVLRHAQRNLDDRRIAASAALELAEIALDEAQDAAAGQLVAEAMGMGAKVAPRALSIVDAREEVNECRAQLEAIGKAAEHLGFRAAEAERQSSAVILELQRAVWAVMQADPQIAALRQLRADVNAAIAMLASIKCWSAEPDPPPDPGIASRWVGAHEALINDPSAVLPAILAIPGGT